MEDLILNGKNGALLKVTWTIADGMLTIDVHDQHAKKTFYLSEVRSVEFSQPGLMGGSIRIDCGASPEGIVGVTRNIALTTSASETIFFKKQSLTTAEAIRDYINNYRTTHASHQSAPSLADELVKLKGLLDAGIITRDELELAKKKLLDI